MKAFSRLAAVVAALLGSVVSPACAGYPDQPITLIVAYDPDGATDVLARALAPFIQRHLGAASGVTVVNRPGAGGEVGFAALADAAADGYTIGFINTPNLVTIPIERPARYRLDRLDPLVNVVDDPGVWTVPQDSPFKTLADVIAHARKYPDTVTVGSTGVGSDDHLAIQQMQRQTGAGFVHVPFPGSRINHRAMLAHKIQICGENLSEALRSSQTEAIRILGVMSAKRWAVAEDVATFKEQGFAVASSSMRGIAAPKGVPADIRAKLVEGLSKAVNDPDFVALAAVPQTYQPLRFLGPDGFAGELRKMDAEYRARWRQAPWLK